MPSPITSSTKRSSITSPTWCSRGARRSRSTRASCASSSRRSRASPRCRAAPARSSRRSASCSAASKPPRTVSSRARANAARCSQSRQTGVPRPRSRAFARSSAIPQQPASLDHNPLAATIIDQPPIQLGSGAYSVVNPGDSVETVRARMLQLGLDPNAREVDHPAAAAAPRRGRRAEVRPADGRAPDPRRHPPPAERNPAPQPLNARVGWPFTLGQCVCARVPHLGLPQDPGRRRRYRAPREHGASPPSRGARRGVGNDGGRGARERPLLAPTPSAARLLPAREHG